MPALTANADSMLFHAGETLPVHEFHHWDSTANGTDFTAAKANGRRWACGFANARLYAGFPHLYWAGTPLPKRFCDCGLPLYKGRTMTENELKTLLKTVTPPDEAARAAAHAHWAALAKPLGGLGRLEAMVEDAAALMGTETPDLAAVPCWCCAPITALWRRVSARPMPT